MLTAKNLQFWVLNFELDLKTNEIQHIFQVQKVIGKKLEGIGSESNAVFYELHDF